MQAQRPAGAGLAAPVGKVIFYPMMSAVVLLAAALATPPALTLDAPGTGRGPDMSARGESRPTLDQRLQTRLADLSAEADAEAAQAIASEVQSLWRQQAGPTADLLLQRATEAQQIGDTATAWRAYDHLRRLEPDYAEGWMASAELAAREADWDFALEALNQAVTLDPDRFDAWAMLGEALERADAREAAMEAYREAVTLHPHHPEAGPALARLERALAGRAL